MSRPLTHWVEYHTCTTSQVSYIDSVEEVVILFEVEVQKPRNLSVHDSEECDHGEGVGVYADLIQSDTLKTYGHVKGDTRQ